MRKASGIFLPVRIDSETRDGNERNMRREEVMEQNQKMRGRKAEREGGKEK